MILETLEVSLPELERRTGWQFKPEARVQGRSLCPDAARRGWAGRRAATGRLAGACRLCTTMRAGCGASAPRLAGALSGVQAPDLVLPDIHGGQFSLRSLLGSKVLLVAWASW